MTDQANTGTSSGTPGGAPAPPISPAAAPPEFDRGSSSSFVRSRVGQMMAQQAQQLASGEPPAADAPQQQQQHAPPPPQSLLGQIDQELEELRAFKAEADVRRNTLPKSDTDYAVKLPANFQLPAGVTFEFDKNSPELAQARKIAHARGMDQETFSDMLGVYAASKISEQTHQAKVREANLAQLGAAGRQRAEAVATWLTAKAGEDGKAVGNFIRQYPSAPIVKAMESLIKQFSSQGGADFSQSHRDQAEEQGKIPGYDNLTFVQKRAIQMQQMLNRPGYRGGGGRRGE